MSRATFAAIVSIAVVASLIALSQGVDAVVTPAFVQTNFAEVNAGKTVQVGFPNANARREPDRGVCGLEQYWHGLRHRQPQQCVHQRCGFDAWNGSLMPQVFYAKSIGGEANSVTATFGTSARR